ncbi:MAG: hypothetical protein ACJ74O_18390 [Frankiaceae bacterium]
MRRCWLLPAYYLLVTPYGLVRRVMRDPLQRRREPRRASYFSVLDRPTPAARSGQ